jgi:hypothetical protein
MEIVTGPHEGANNPERADVTNELTNLGLKMVSTGTKGLNAIDVLEVKAAKGSHSNYFSLFRSTLLIIACLF